MFRVQLPGDVATCIAARIERFALDSPDQLKWQCHSVAEFGALPLYHGWVETIGIRPDGELVRWSTENEYQGVKPLEDRIWMLTALVVGL